jgi:hypothetical protein
MPSPIRSLIPAIVCAVGLFVVAGVIFVFVYSSNDQGNDKSRSGKTPVPGEVVERPPLPSDDYVGSESCRRCHESIWNRYQAHPMSNSAATIGEETPREDYSVKTSFSVSTPIGEVDYRVEKTAEGVFHHESLTDPTLGTIYDQRVRINYVIGSGRHGRSYVFAENDCLFMSPITWYSDDNRWELSPNYRPEKNPRFERRILQACLVCHAERVSVNREAPHHFSSAAFIEAKIGCESCHGPGHSHVLYQERRAQLTESVASETDPIVNPARLDPERRESVCWQCHLSAEERIPRYGRLDSDFRPGMAYEDVWTAFVRGTHQDETGTLRVASHVEQTRASLCFQRSDGRFGCLSCHDSHSVPGERDKVNYYREKCLSCHSTNGCALPPSERIERNSEDSCIACHMPVQGLNRIPHTSRTDHRIVRTAVQEDPPSEEHPLTIFKPGKNKLPQTEEDRAWGLVLAKFAYLRGDVETARSARQKLATVQSSVPDDLLVIEWLGTCEQLLNHPDTALSHWRRILETQPNHEGALQRIADLELTQPNLGDRKDALLNYLNVNPWTSNYQLRLAAVFGELGQLDEAASRAVEALRINPTTASAHRILAEVYKRQGKRNESEHHTKMYRRLER